jgi:hypothetical protein
VLGACGAVPPDDGVAETGNEASESESEGESATESASSSGANGSMTSTASETSSASASEAGEEESSASISTGSTAEDTGAAEESGAGEDTGPHDTGGEGPLIPLECEDLVCDGATEYCYESIFDGPSEFSCEPIPLRCAADPSCDCIVPIDCPESLQSCDPVEGGIRLECVTG